MNVRPRVGGTLAPTLLLLFVSVSVVSSATRVEAQQAFGFDKPTLYNLVVPQFTDRQVTQLITTLDALLGTSSGPGQWTDSARTTLPEFSRRLQTARLSAGQESRVLDHLSEIERAHPEDAAVQAAQSMVRMLTIGKAAPEISGKDLDDAPFRLSDYRGKVVVLMFWGDWCGICRTQYPYERLLLELYKNWPFAIVGVNSDASREIARQSALTNKLAYRSWWDGGAQEPTKGPIASAWNVDGWPTVYVLDGRGIIRYVDIGHEDLLKGVQQLLSEQTRAAKPKPSSSK